MSNELAARPHQPVQVHPLDVFHQVERVLFVVAEDLHDVGVAQVGDELGFVEKAVQELRILTVLGPELLGDVDRPECHVTHAPQLAHAPDCHPVEELVVAHPPDRLIFFHAHAPDAP